jgi:hypothetical protein
MTAKALKQKAQGLELPYSQPLTGATHLMLYFIADLEATTESYKKTQLMRSEQL